MPMKSEYHDLSKMLYSFLIILCKQLFFSLIKSPCFCSTNKSLNIFSPCLAFLICLIAVLFCFDRYCIFFYIVSFAFHLSGCNFKSWIIFLLFSYSFHLFFSPTYSTRQTPALPCSAEFVCSWFQFSTIPALPCCEELSLLGAQSTQNNNDDFSTSNGAPPDNRTATNSLFYSHL